MRLKSAFLVVSVLLAGCGEIRNPLSKPPAVVDSPVPADFAIVVEQATDSYYARETTHQVITASDMMSRTTYTYYRDYNNTIASQFTTEHPLNAGQLQAMWNEVQRYKLLQGASTWYFWEGHMDDYRRNERMMEIRAGGKSQTFKQLNHWSYKLRDLALDVASARLPVTHGDGMPPATAPATLPTTAPATMPATMSAPMSMEPAPTTNAATAPATQP